jgi:hypothetical protein
LLDAAAERPTRAAARRPAIDLAELGAIATHDVVEACSFHRVEPRRELGEQGAAGGGVAHLVGEDLVEHAADRGLGGRVAIRTQRVDRLLLGDDDLAPDDVERTDERRLGARRKADVGEIDGEAGEPSEPLDDTDCHLRVPELVAHQAMDRAQRRVRRFEIGEQAQQLREHGDAAVLVDDARRPREPRCLARGVVVRGEIRCIARRRELRDEPPEQRDVGHARDHFVSFTTRTRAGSLHTHRGPARVWNWTCSHAGSAGFVTGFAAGFGGGASTGAVLDDDVVVGSAAGITTEGVVGSFACSQATRDRTRAS